MVIGIDVAADWFHCVALETNGSFIGGRVYAPDDLPVLMEWAAGADVIAIDAPAQLSTARHSADESLKPRTATTAAAMSYPVGPFTASIAMEDTL